jgi:hypothetical protein
MSMGNMLARVMSVGSPPPINGGGPPAAAAMGSNPPGTTFNLDNRGGVGYVDEVGTTNAVAIAIDDAATASCIDFIVTTMLF